MTPPAGADEAKSPYKAFQPQPVEPHYGRDRGFSVSHSRLELRLDERAGTIEGTATLTVQAILRLTRIQLDAEGLDVSEVRWDGKRASFEAERKKLRIVAPRALGEGQSAQVAVRYRARPRRGLYFIRPDRHYPRKPVQVWSQGESEDNRCWFPGYDYPNNKATSEALMTVRKGLTAISNGRLVDTRPAGGGWVTYHWKQDLPQANYLVAVVVGRFEELRDEWRGVPLHYFVPKGLRDWGRETFKHTPQILDFFSRATGYPYPFAKYAQAVIADFMWGGMENTSMTTVNERFLVLAQHREDADPDGLVAHEAAHQWFGNLVTNKSWEHIWLNEGFATYFDALFHESFYGPDTFQDEMQDNAQAYFAEDAEHYRRPLVTRHFRENEDVFDHHTYQKGALVLHMLRRDLGDDLWWKSVRHYLKKHAGKNVETNDLKVAIEEATGRNLDAFFDQWVYKAGYPELEASYQYDEKRRLVRLTIKQVQKVVDETPLFRFDLDVWAWSSPERHAKHTLHVSKAEESFFLPAGTRPKLIQLDPNASLLKKLKFERDADEWIFQLRHSPTAAGRMEAAQALAKKASDPHSVPALERALAQDPFWGARRAAALALGEHETAEALQALRAGLSDKHPKVRRGAAEALGHFPGSARAAAWLKRLAAKDRSDYVVARALHSLAKIRSPGVERTLRAHLRRKSHNDVIAVSCLASLAELKDPRALPTILDHTAYGKPQMVRSGATHAAAKIWDFVDKRGQEEIRRAFQRLLKDPLHHERRSAMAALANVPDPALRDRLSAVAEDEPIGLLRRVARTSLRENSEKGALQSQLGDLKKQFDELKEENRKLKAGLAELEKKMARHK